MYLKRMTIKNFRKFGENDNTIDFVTPYTERKFKSSAQKKSIANATTLIVGKNNSGKTTITAALSHAILSEKISGSKFNYHYLEKLFNSYFNAGLEDDNLVAPAMEFIFYIGLDTNHYSVNINNLSSFIKVENLNSRTIQVSVCYEVKESRLYTSLILKYIHEWERQKLSREEMFRLFILVISNEIEFVRRIYDVEGSEISNFRLNDLIDIKIIKANLEDNSRTLSAIFNKIVQYNLNLPAQKSEKLKITDELYKVNKEITQMIGERHNAIVNDVVSKITDKSNMKVHLQANMNFNNTFNKVINYEFKENNHFIPEDQFGLGYTNLMKILGQLIDYIEHFEDDDSFSKVNIICVEEPENYMHPQMQELFINNIDTALDLLLSKTKKNINSQLLLTTHSSHILNSKVHNSGTFDNLNYIFTSSDKCAKVVCLRDQIIANTNNEKDQDKISKEELSFLKTHIKFKVSDLFFSDAVILVEGITEEQLLKYYISIDPFFNKASISIFNINGAFAHVYKRLLDILGIPCLAITDLDVKRTTEEKNSFSQLTSLSERSTTNAVIKKYVCLDAESKHEDEDEDEDEDGRPAKLPSNLDYYIDEKDGGFKVVYQKKPINKYYASSFEEAFILKNYNKTILNITLKTIKPRIFKQMINSNGTKSLKNSIIQSYKWQRKLSSNKSEFANTLLYFLLSTDYARPDLPDYISDGLLWLKKKINFLRKN